MVVVLSSFCPFIINLTLPGNSANWDFQKKKETKPMNIEEGKIK